MNFVKKSIEKKYLQSMLLNVYFEYWLHLIILEDKLANYQFIITNQSMDQDIYTN